MTTALAKQPNACATLAMLSRRKERSAIVHAVTLEDLDQIHSSQVELVIWERQLAAGLSNWLAALHRISARMGACWSPPTTAGTPSDNCWIRLRRQPERCGRPSWRTWCR